MPAFAGMTVARAASPVIAKARERQALDDRRFALNEK
jgi:hypothetical protein